LGGSYYVEALTNKVEAAVFDILEKVDQMGGTIPAIEQGYFQRAIAESAYNYAKRKESGDQVVVGVNKYVDPVEPANIEIHRIDPDAEARQIKRLHHTRAHRNNAEVERLLERLAAEAESPSTNLLPVTVELVKARASIGEIVQRLRAVYGSYVETPVF
ncbi:MAG TPA: methylmalonyl-CoA mutase family protein, partial [Vicinamibacterales bacterium]|nr:methylmalonyl-CoA mutase family protein [Vicinamibacterales bacterium]